jgi:HEAT repeat protein
MGRRAEVRKQLVRVIQLADDKDVAGLIRELSNPVQGRTSYGIPRANAANALGNLGDHRAIPHLIGMRDDPEWGVRTDVFHALGLLKAKEAVGVLVEGLNDTHSYPRQRAAEALGRIGDPAVIPRLREVADSDADGKVRLHAVESLLLLGDRDSLTRIPGALRGVPWRVRGGPRWKRLTRYAETGGRLTPWFEVGEISQ